MFSFFIKLDYSIIQTFNVLQSSLLSPEIAGNSHNGKVFPYKSYKSIKSAATKGKKSHVIEYRFFLIFHPLVLFTSMLNLLAL